MPAASTILASIALAGAVGGGVFAANQANKQRKTANSLAQDDARRADQQIKSFQQKTDPVKQKAEEKKVGGDARRRQSALAKQAVGRRSTILTGPLGLSDEPTSKGKTLLGT